MPIYQIYQDLTAEKLYEKKLELFLALRPGDTIFFLGDKFCGPALVMSIHPTSVLVRINGKNETFTASGMWQYEALPPYCYTRMVLSELDLGMDTVHIAKALYLSAGTYTYTYNGC